MRLIMILIVAMLFSTAGVPSFAFTSGELTAFQNAKNLVESGIYAVNSNAGVGTTGPRSKLEINNTAAFSSEYDNGNSGTSKTIDWNNGNKQKITLTGNCTLTFTAPAGGVGNYQLLVIQDGTGSRTLTWPGTVKWAGGVASTLTLTAAGVDIISFYYNGTNYYACAALGFN